LSSALPSSAGAGNFTFDYTTNIVRPLRIPAARRLPWQGLNETPLGRTPGQMLSRQEYMDLPNKNTLGIPTSAFYNPARTQGELFVWPAPQDANSAIRFTWYRPIENFNTVDDIPDFPDEWTNFLGWDLASELGPDYSVPEARQARIATMAAQKLEMCEGWDREPQSIFFGRAYSPSGR
jgi:hypothetical protein